MEKPKIMVVDDDLPILALMKTVLGEFGFDPVTVSSGAAGLRLAVEHPPELVLLDMHMPGMSGAEFIERLHQEAGLSTVPILILSGDRITSDEMRRIGAAAAIQKPFDLMQLIDCIKEHLAPGAAGTSSA